MFFLHAVVRGLPLDQCVVDLSAVVRENLSVQASRQKVVYDRQV